MLENIKPISIATNQAIESFNDIDKDNSGTLSVEELEIDTANAFLAENTRDIATLDTGFFSSDDEIDLQDLKKLKNLNFQTSLDAAMFEPAKEFFLANHEKLDENRDGKVSRLEVANYRDQFKVSPEELASLDYLSKRMSGNYTDGFQDSGSESGTGQDKYFASAWTVEDLRQMTLKDRVSQTQKEIMSTDMIQDWEDGVGYGGKLSGLALGAILGPASGPGALAAPAAGYIAGGIVGSRIGWRIGRQRMDNYYESSQREKIDRIFKNL